jgi:hypothetical protein
VSNPAAIRLIEVAESETLPLREILAELIAPAAGAGRFQANEIQIVRLSKGRS